ncbi:hypothetical protein RHGRI_036936 [Rhododendron griersonianum]|uniref:Uncharacterized protein n=1 Tax=Rhododendron griersonianum TaxID=479676 RepID=A0AAV6HPZ6_9ERIC|nr:hypothetical protein RHGRI_036936 [Rhododendron griersonianum]
MFSILNSQGVVLSTVIAVSGIVIFLALTSRSLFRLPNSNPLPSRTSEIVSHNSQDPRLSFFFLTGIQPNGRFYETGMVVEEDDKSGNCQLYQIVVCVDFDGNRIIYCPRIPMGKGSVLRLSSFFHSKDYVGVLANNTT